MPAANVFAAEAAETEEATTEATEETADEAADETAEEADAETETEEDAEDVEKTYPPYTKMLPKKRQKSRQRISS